MTSPKTIDLRGTVTNSRRQNRWVNGGSAEGSGKCTIVLGVPVVCEAEVGGSVNLQAAADEAVYSF